MPRDRLKPKRASNVLIWAGLILPMGVYVLAFWSEISRALGYVLDWFMFMFGRPAPVLNAALGRDLRVTFFTLFIAFGFTFLLWLLLTSFQAVLPVADTLDVLQTLAHQILYLLGMHGLAVLVKDGQKLASAEEVQRSGPGVVVVDFNSAVVLERVVGPPGFMRPLLDLLERIGHLLGFTRHAAPVVYGPGLIFTMPSQRIRGTVDLRVQARGSGPVSAYTRDGIELNSQVYTVFSVGQGADVVQVTYTGERRMENLRVISTEILPGQQVRVRILEEEELESDDLQEIHAYARIPNQANDSAPFSDLPAGANRPVFDADRVFAAVFAQARDLSQERLLPWTDLPARVCLDIFRQTLSQINYNDLYDLENPSPDEFPLPRIKRLFAARVRNSGVLSFRVVFLRSGQPLANGTYPQADLLCSPVRPLTAPHVLRERGIKVIKSAFSSPVPPQEVIQQRLTSWRAHWEAERELISASRELEAATIRSRARITAQREMTRALGALFEGGELNDEALAVRVLQALESTAADPKTREFLPADTIRLMEHIHRWLLGERAAGALQGAAQDGSAALGAGDLSAEEEPL